MRLRCLYEAKSLILYKGISEATGLRDWSTNKHGETGTQIPGFLGDWDTARIYSDPSLTDIDDQSSMIAEFQLDSHNIEDRTEQFIEWARSDGPNQGQKNPWLDISVSYPKEWRSDQTIWTVNLEMTAHGSFAYASIPLPYTIIRSYRNQSDWEEELPYAERMRREERRQRGFTG